MFDGEEGNEEFGTWRGLRSGYRVSCQFLAKASEQAGCIYGSHIDYYRAMQALAW